MPGTGFPDSRAFATREPSQSTESPPVVGCHGRYRSASAFIPSPPTTRPHYALPVRPAPAATPCAASPGEEFEASLKCGRLEYGFLRVKCDACRHEKRVAFSCKRRGLCPSCGARRMSETAAHLVEHVLPEQPIRQYRVHRNARTHREDPHPSRRARDRRHQSPPRTTAPCASHPTPGLHLSSPVLTAPAGAPHCRCASPPVPCGLQRLPDMPSCVPARYRVTSQADSLSRGWKMCWIRTHELQTRPSPARAFQIAIFRFPISDLLTSNQPI